MVQPPGVDQAEPSGLGRQAEGRLAGAAGFGVEVVNQVAVAVAVEQVQDVAQVLLAIGPAVVFQHHLPHVAQFAAAGRLLQDRQFLALDVELEEVHRLVQVVGEPFHTHLDAALPPPDVAAGAAVRREGDRAGLGAQGGVNKRDIGQAVTGHVFLQDAEDGRVRLKADDASLRVDVLEVENGHTHVAAAVDDQRVGPDGVEVVDASNEFVLVLHVEVGTVGDADSVVQEPHQ